MRIRLVGLLSLSLVFLACQEPTTSDGGNSARAKGNPPPDDGGACIQVVVCGNDGKLYPTPCDATKAGVKYTTDLGFCRQAEDPIKRTDPVEPPVCGKPVTEPADGIVCIDVFAPVCGADGKTYSNSCFASAAKTAIAHEGACP